MKQSTVDLMRIYALDDAVDAFVEAQTPAEGRREFAFVGSGSGWARCPAEGRGEAHPPHWTGESYPTVRHGRVERFCRGREGALPDGRQLVIVRDAHCRPGDPGSLSRFAGYFVIDGPAS